MMIPATSTETAAQFGARLFEEADSVWQRHTDQTPEDVGDLLQYFSRLRELAGGIDEEADRLGLPQKQAGAVWRRNAKEAFRLAALAKLRENLTEWEELAERESEVFDLVRTKFGPAACQGLIFPNDPPAAYWDVQAFGVLHRTFQALAIEMGLECPDRPAPVRTKTPSTGLNRHEKRAWKKMHRRAAA